MDESEITCIVKDENGIISHCGVKGYDIHNIELIGKLIMEETCSFFFHEGETKKRNVYAETSNGTTFLTTDSSGCNIDGLNFLPLFDRPFVRQLIESVR